MITATRVPGVTGGSGCSNRYSRNALVPTTSTTSCGASASRISRRRQCRCPANSAWSCGNPARAPNGSCHTGQLRRSASATSAPHPSGLSAPAPTTIAGFSAPATSSTRSWSSVDEIEVALTTCAGAFAASSSAGCSQSLIGTTTSAGPAAAFASWYARAIVPGTSWARIGVCTHTGYSPASRSSARPVRNGSNAICRRSCWPTTTTSGARVSRALAIALIALPRPGAVWRLTNDGSPVAIA